MATVTKNWANGDLLTLITSAGGIAVSSAENLTGADREMTIRVQTTNQGTKAFQDVMIKQNKASVIQEGYWVHKDTAVKTYFGADAPFINNGVMSRPDWAENAVEITFPDGLTSIGSYAFELCTSLTSITLPEGLTSIGESAFDSCESLSAITLPDSLTSIANFAFYYCTSLTSITFPEGLTSIGNYAFDSCSLTSITLPEGLTSIGPQAFYSCISLSLVTSLPTIPPSLGGNVFGNTHANLIIKVPAQSVNAYKTATNWNSYASKISAI